MRARRWIGAAALCLGSACLGQVGVPGFANRSRGENAESTASAVGGMETAARNPFEGSVPGRTASGEELALSLADAIERGLKANLGLMLTDQGAAAARGARRVSLSRLLPTLSIQGSETSEQLNLAAFGLKPAPGTPSVVGPFGIFDFRGVVSQTILNLRNMDTARASTESLRAAEFQVKDARDAVTLVVAALYLQAQSGASRIEAVKAQVAGSRALYEQAADFKKAGTVPAIDVLRAQVELQAQQQRLIAARNAYEKQKLQLGRAIGLPDGQAIRLTDAMPDKPAQAPEFEEALRQAYAARMDYQSLAAKVKAAEWARKAASAGRYPTVDFNGDYGVMGPSAVNSHGVYTASVGVKIPVFDGRRVQGEVEQAAAALGREKAQLEDMRGRIAYEIRAAMLDVKAAADLVAVSKGSVELAKQQETQARDRFAAGVTNNLEVVQAQEALAGANENYISSLLGYNIAKASLARAIGGVEAKIRTLLLGSE
ncbi:MAG: TolC family protein [Bryobacterales bacterium]|nr:TolC family protein [Bryobacterales bacterium]